MGRKVHSTIAALFVAGLWTATGTGSEPASNGDVNGDQIVDLTDAVYILTHLFQGGPPPLPLPCEESQVEIVVQTAVADAAIYRDWNANCGVTEPAGATLFRVATRSGTQRICRGLVRFDLPPEAGGKSLRKVTLRLFAVLESEYRMNIFNVGALSEAWEEASATWCARTSEAEWAEPGALFGTTWTDAIVIPKQCGVVGPTCDLGTWFEWDVTAAVEGWLSGIPNYGFVLWQEDISNSKDNQVIGFASKDNEDPERRPQLVLEFDR